MQTFPSAETVLLTSSSPPLLLNPGGDDVDIDFKDVFGGPPKRRSKVNELIRHSFSDTALRRLDVVVDNNSALVPRDDLWDGRDEKPVFGEDTSVRRRLTADDFFADIFGANETSPSSLPGSRIRSPAQPIPHKAESPARQVKATEIPTFGSATRSLIKNNETVSSSSLSGTSGMVGSAAKSGSQVVIGKGRQFQFSIYNLTNNGVPVVIWGSSRLSSVVKAEETTPSDSGFSGLAVEKMASQKRPGVLKVEEKIEIASTLKQAFSGDVLKAHEASVKPLHSCLDEEAERQGEDIVMEGEVRKDKSKAKNKQRSSAGDSKKAQGSRSSLPDKSSFASTSPAPEVGKDGVKGKVMDFVKIFSQGGAGGESLGQSSRWRAKEKPMSDIKNDGANTKENVNISNKPIPDILATDQDPKPSQATQKKDPERVSVDRDKRSGVTEQEKRRKEPSKTHATSEGIDEPIHVNFLVEDIITQDEKTREETKNNAEEIQNIDAKIRKWSSGKSGNIRSLLSTLQYILWPGSGWKAVPLMDLIEGNAVRKSYQRALLILHPDKLLQKGASDNQKYTAEKVFELLQEAWDHFNTLGPV